MGADGQGDHRREAPSFVLVVFVTASAGFIAIGGRMTLNRPYCDITKLPKIVPVFPLARVLLLPRGELPLNIFEPRYVAMIDRAIAGDRIIGMIQPLEGSEDLETDSQLYPTGCVGKITRFSETGDGRYLVDSHGCVALSRGGGA